jgi:pimeloyl-ACP methyl ester carboxylesterase
VNPLIQYAEATDGVRIAYYAMGRGVPLLVTPMLPWAHLQNTHVFKEHYRSQSAGGLGRGMQVVRYDARGTGLSARGAIDFSIDAQLRDLEAVRSALALERFVLFGRQAGCLLAVAYAARHPARVSHLVLAEPVIRGSDLAVGAASAGLAPVPNMTREQWEAFTLATANIAVAYSSQPAARAMAKEYRDAMTPPAYERYLDWRRAVDVSDLLPQIDVPTLVVSRRRAYLHATAVRVASSIHGARMFTSEPDREIPGRWLPEETAAVEEFLGTASAGSPHAEAARDDAARLTKRETDVLELLVAGRSNRQIAEDLVLSERTVARHIANMYAKAGVHGRAEITAYALRHRLV